MRTRISINFAVGLLAVLASLVAKPVAALAAAPQHHNQAPGFYRLKVGDLEVTTLFDGPGVAQPQWLNGDKTVSGVVKALQTDPHFMDASDQGYLVNTGKQLILIDAGSGTWWGGPDLGHLTTSLRSAGYTPEQVDIVLITHMHADHIGGLTTKEGKIVFPKAQIYVSKADNDFWLSKEMEAKAPKGAHYSLTLHKPSQRPTSRPASGTPSATPITSLMACRSYRFMAIPLNIPATNSLPKDKRFCFGETSSTHSASSSCIPM